MCVLEGPACAVRLSTRAFVLQAAMGRAEEVLADRAVIRIGADGAAGRAAALRRLGRVIDRLQTALDRRVGVKWLDRAILVS